MQTIKTGVYKNITIIVKVDQKAEMYLTDGNKPINANEIDDCFIYREANYLRTGFVGNRKKYTKIILLKAYSKKALNNRCKNMDNWIESETNRIGKAKSSTMQLFNNVI